MNLSKISNKAIKELNIQSSISNNETKDILPFNYDINDNPKLIETYNYIKNDAPIIFLTGGAGTGKSTFIKFLKNNLKKETNKNCIVLAPTGIAAINVGGQTIHSFFNFKFDPFNNIDIKRSIKNPVVDHTDLFIIDEISMVRSCMIDHIDYALRLWCDSDLPFGGKQILLIGDCFQLPPITNDSDENAKKFYSQWESPYFFAAKVFESPDADVKAVQLEKIYRQKDDIHFINILNRIRKCENGYQKDINFLNNKCYIESRLHTKNVPENSLFLSTKKRKADDLNTKKLIELQNKGQIIRKYNAFIEGNFSSKDPPSPTQLDLCVNAKVMITKNIPSKKLINGDMGKVLALGGNGNSQDDYVDVFIKGNTYRLNRESWQSFKYRWDEQTKTIKQIPVASFNQIPLRLGWAVTIHKSQGLTLDSVVIDADDAWDPGQIYVALSRAKNLNGVLLYEKIPFSQVKADPYIKKVYQELFNDTSKLSTYNENEYKEILLNNSHFTVNTEKVITSVNIEGHIIPLFPENTNIRGALQEHVRKTMSILLENNLIPNDEIKRLVEDIDYCYRTFGINYNGYKYPLLKTSLISNSERYWKQKYNGFYICSQWYQNLASKYARWLMDLSKNFPNRKDNKNLQNNNSINSDEEILTHKINFNKMNTISKNDNKNTKILESYIAKRSAEIIDGKNKFTKKDGTFVFANESGMRNNSLPWTNKDIKLSVYEKKNNLLIDWSWNEIE